MAGEWEDLTLGDLGRVVTGKTPLTAVEGNFGGQIPFVTPSDMDGRRTISTTARCLTETGAASVKGSKIPAGSVMVSCIGSDMGKAVIAGRDCVTNQQINSIVVDDRFSSEFVYYNLSTRKDEIRHQAAGGSAQPILNKGDFSRLEITLPPLAEQKAIAAVLGALDDKIELNRRMNATLEAMARALFQSWFIDFDPVRQNMDRNQNQPSPVLRPPSPSGRGAGGEGTAGLLDGRPPAALDPATAALFPDSFQDSEAGHIPKGWPIQPVGEVVDCVGGGTPSTAEPKYWECGTHHWTTPKDFSSLQAPVLLDTDRKLTDAGIAKISSGLLPAGTLLLSSRAPVGYLAIAAMPVAINQGFIAMKCNERASNFFMLNWCQTNMAEIESRATGTTFAEISKQNFRPIRVVLPPKELMVAFTAKVAPLYAQITANLHQSRTLATLRDTLLPKLLSGELSVADAEEVVHHPERQTV